MQIYLTGYKGRLGKEIINASTEKIKTLEYNYKDISPYKDLRKLNHKDVIIHAGASLNYNLEKQLFYQNNYKALTSLVNTCRISGTKLIFISANSIGKYKLVSDLENFRDYYTLLKYKCEQYIQKLLPNDQFYIIRLPGLYSKNEKGHGFLDKVFYSKNKVFKIEANSKFNNLCLYSAAAKFITKLIYRDRFEGFIGSLSSLGALDLEEICRHLIKVQPSLSSFIDFNYKFSHNNSVFESSKAISLGFSPKRTNELIHYLYDRNY